jgi:hypothetical protein
MPAPSAPPPLLSAAGGSGSLFLPSPAPSRAGSDAASMLISVPSMPLPFASAPLVRQNTIATLAILMCQNEYLSRAQGRPLDRSFSDGARALMAAMAASGDLPEGGEAAAAAPLQLGSAAPTWARNAAQ